MDLSIVRSDSDVIHAERKLDTGESVIFMARDVRHEKTGMHGEVGIMFRDRVLGGHVFNLGRADARGVLIREAWPHLESAGEVTTAAYPKPILAHDLTQFCFYLRTEWEQGLVDIVSYDHAGEAPKRKYPLYPYLIENSGTLIYAPPESGKSILTQAMAVCIAADISHIWEVQQAPVLYINLERPARALEARERSLLRALGVPEEGRNRVEYLHMRGRPLESVLRKARPYLKANPGAVVVLDSVSRTRLGSLVEDSTAMLFIDMMGDLGVTWIGIGHTPRATADHMYGSVHYDAGADIMLKLSAERTDSHLGLLLEMTKANDIKRRKPAYYALEFRNDQLEDFAHSNANAFPALYSGSKKSTVQQIKDYISSQHNQAWQKDIATALDIDAGYLSKTLNDPKHGFKKVRSEDQRNLWTVLTTSTQQDVNST
jgi:hypothetical protein